jgi:hypothetical protein
MKGTARLSVALAASVACAALTTIAKAADFDWKMYAGAAVLKPEACFYDAKGVVRTPERLVRVWTRCFSRKDLNNWKNLKRRCSKIKGWIYAADQSSGGN